MKNIFYILILGITVFFSACEDPGTSILFDENFIELDAATTVTKQRTYSYLRLNDGVPKASGFKVNLGARQKSTPVSFSFEILSSSTAIENLHYSVGSFSGTFPANSSVTELPISILADNIDAGEQWSIVVKIISQDVPVHELYGTGSHLIQVSCPPNPSDWVGTYNTLASGGAGDGSGGTAQQYTNLAGTVVITSTSIESVYQFSDMSFNLYPGGFGDIAPMGRFRENCGTTFTDVGDTDRYGDPFTINGTRNPTTGEITLSWSNTWGDTGNVVLTRQ
ncbi:MAG TPA: hypothetical protein PKC30_14235 [Saprospiraceae bacterium]|nr:hypothetical protein [Saprospiraceae bacterium]